MRRQMRSFIAAMVVASLWLVAASAPARAAWTPDKAVYGTGLLLDQPVTMDDGTVLRVNVCYPTVASSGAEASGPFPVLLTQTPYGKGSSCGDSYMVQRGYIYVAADVRGTGDSGGMFDLFQPQEARDGATLVRWAVKLPHAAYDVGLTGCSYLGINQLMTAGALPAGSPLKAILPECAGPSIYDLQYQGGMNDNEWNTFYWGLTGGENLAGPAEEAPKDPSDAAYTEAAHVAGTINMQGKQEVEEQAGGPEDANDAYWQVRAPARYLPAIVAHQIPALITGGWSDLIGQHGAPELYAQFQNLWAGRPQFAPMAPDQVVTGRYQLIEGQWYHGGATPGMEQVRLEWFDNWLKGESTGIADTATPLHAYENGAKRWVDTASYPFAPAKPTRYYLGAGTTGSAPQSANDGALSRSRPADPSAADQIAYTNATSPCNEGTAEWTAGLANSSCSTDDRPLQTGPSALTYSTAPLTTPVVLAGPIDVTVFATSTTAGAEWVATVEDVAPDGTSHPYATGSLLGSFRALDTAKTWYAGDGSPLDPVHPFTAASAEPVTAGKVTRYDIEVYPNLAEIPAGDRIRVTITTSDVPHLQPNAVQEQDLLGGVYQLQRNAKWASWVELPLAPANGFPHRCGALCS
jgi:uncharacterized protein